MTKDSPFNLSNDSSYQQWREDKLDNFSSKINHYMTDIENINTPSANEIKSLTTTTNKHNLSLYRYNSSSHSNLNNKQKIHHLANLMGLKNLDKNICADEDRLTSITVALHKNQHQYIPYSNKKLSWHTDGYYNTPENQIYGMLLHCEQPSKSGGTNLFLDHDLAYILLRDESPDYIKAFMQHDAMTIPANILNGKEIRAAQNGPIFSLNPTGKLHMRYSARLRNITWKQDTPTLEAKTFLQELWKNGSPYILRHTLQANEGLICNNVLHSRTSFEDHHDPQQKRLLFRGRYLDRVKHN